MIYLITCIVASMFFCWSLIFFKSYQLNQYKIKSFLKDIILLRFAFGDKNKIIWTKRLIRFCILYLLLSFLIFFLINFYISNIALLILNYAVIFLLAPILLSVAHLLILPFENLIKKRFIIKAKKKLKKKNILKIAITGSYGKTSTKNILTHILEKEYKVCVTPLNYNTEMGVTKTILNILDDHDVFIAEMGARHRFDIKKVADIVNPDIAIITTIGKAHLETFGSLTNIEKTKYELCESLNKNGKAIFNGDNKSSMRLYNKFQGNKFLVNDRKGFVYCENIKCSEKGTFFDLIIDKKRFKAHTPLLGKCNINNIATAVSVAKILNISEEDILNAISTLSPTPHRLEIISQNPTIIDDSYNSNEIGFMEALDVLSKFNKTKIVVTPGIVELGEEQSQTNFKIGCKMADVADFIVIMNNTNKNDLYSGAISHNFNKKNIFFANSRKQQEDILKLLVNEVSVILFENDLPDNYM